MLISSSKVICPSLFTETVVWCTLSFLYLPLKTATLPVGLHDYTHTRPFDISSHPVLLISVCTTPHLLVIMPVSSPYPSIEIPNIDLWTFLFERKDRPFPDDKGSCIPCSFHART